VTADVTALPVAAGQWSVSDARTRITFTVANFGRPVQGSLACIAGGIELRSGGEPARAWAEIDLRSLDTGVARRDSDLRKPRLLDIDRHPVMTWRCDGFAPTGDGGWTGTGQLRVRGTTAPMTVTGRAEVRDGDGPWLRVRAEAVIDRTAVGIRAPSFLIGRTVTVAVDAWLSPVRW
jgi:polyisoprenoid-binding protein YceI